MGILDAVLGAASSLDDYVSDLLGGFDFIADLDSETSGFFSDVLGGAVTNAALAGISGGDVGQAALYGGVGGFFNDDNSFLGDYNQFGDELGGAISGYGVGGGMGALGGALGGLAQDETGLLSRSTAPGSSAEMTSDEAGYREEELAAAAGKTPEGGGGAIGDKIKGLLMTESGDGTILGKAAMSGIAGMAEQQNAEDLMDKQQEIAQENYRERDRVDAQAEQNRVGAFTKGAPAFKIQR